MAENDKGRTLGADGGGVATITLDGTDYAFYPLTQADKAEFEAWARAAALAEARAMKDELAPNEYRQLVEDIMAARATGAYGIGGAASTRWVESEPGLKLIARLALRPGHKQVPDDVMDRLYTEKADEFVAAIREALHVPNRNGRPKKAPKSR